MTDTIRLKLPLVQAAQAQKHVTVNEALTRLDGMVQLVLASDSVTQPPLSAPEGTAYAVPQGAVAAWAGRAGQIAIAVNGGWDFVTPGRGWRAYLADRGALALFDGAVWQAGALALSPFGAALRAGVAEADHPIGTGPVSITAALIPAQVLVIGVTARVTGTIGGSLSDWALGNPGAPGRFGSGIGLAAGTWLRGLLGQPMAFYAPTPLELVATGGEFSGGSLRIAVHYLDLTLPGL